VHLLSSDFIDTRNSSPTHLYVRESGLPDNIGCHLILVPRLKLLGFIVWSFAFLSKPNLGRVE
jgi:hypothetical protein